MSSGLVVGHRVISYLCFQRLLHQAVELKQG